ncbi:MAG: DUF4384 domain-containing protein [Hyphomicrobiales bacterium]|nr:DUF4384 domain-containing protein [Hyphomicrobiales bacterium]
MIPVLCVCAATALPARADTDAASKAGVALQRHCAACHQDGPAGTDAATTFRHVLDLARLARDPAYVVPGNPDASRLLAAFHMRWTPHDVIADKAAAPTAAEMLAVRDWIAGLPAAGPPAAVPSPAPLALSTDRPRYAPGEPIVISVTVRRACHLTIVSVDATGRATVLLPNDFQTANLIEAGTTVKVPADAAPYVLRADGKGRETVVAICQAGQASPFGIRHDFDRRRFTELGNWRDFLAATWTRELAERHAAAPAKSRRERRRARRVRQPAPPPPPGPVEEIRTAVQFVVE